MLDFQRIAESIIGLTTASLLVKLFDKLVDKLYAHPECSESDIEEPDIPLSTHIQNHYMLPITPLS